VEAKVITLEYLKRFHELLARLDVTAVERVVEHLRRTRDADGTVYVAGNGGSASTASHWANDLGKATKASGRAFMRVMCLSDNVSWLTAPANDEGYEHQVAELARIAVAAVPGCELEVLGRPSADQRTYKADFGKFARTFPDVEFRWTPENGARELRDAFESTGLSKEKFDDERFIRLRWLNRLLETSALDGELRWTADRVGASQP
jgi:hypothetical protein